jgi:Ribulose-5-phosphate 4-epimerase and related epimerases and aldolases
VKLPDGTILATPTNSSFGRLVPDRLSRVAPDGTLLSGLPPSKECAFHLKIYEARPECGAVVHLHSTYATALASLRDLNEEDVIRPVTPYYAMKVAPLPLVPYYKPGSAELVAAVAATARVAACMLLANHGPVVTGRSLEDAVNTAEELEETAKLAFLLHGHPLGIRYLEEEQMRELIAAK